MAESFFDDTDDARSVCLASPITEPCNWRGVNNEKTPLRRAKILAL